MPRFRYSELNRNPAPEGVHLAQVMKATQTVSKTSGNEMLTLSLRTIPDGFWLTYYLVFSRKDGTDGIITQFCRYCEGELRFPEDPQDEYSVTATDCVHRLIFVDVEHEGEAQNLKAKVKLAGILPRAKALALRPDLAKIKLPANVPPPQDVAILPKEEKPVRRSGSAGTLPPPGDDIPF